MTTLTQHDITAGLRALGLDTGHQVLVHSSLSSFGYVEGGADAVIDALLDTVGPGGTVLVPTLTGSEALSPQNPPVFDPLHTPCWTGRIPETFRQRPGAVRSLHPTHSVAAIGADAQALTADHIDSLTPCDNLSPYAKLAQSGTGYILLIGVDHQSNTTMHHVEELAGVPYHMQPGLARARILVDGREIVRHIMLHAYGSPRRFNVMEPLYLERGIQRSAHIGQAAIRLIHARRMVDITLQALRANARLLCE
jgi:aminoglycoside 3-N-acetyltransferase